MSSEGVKETITMRRFFINVDEIVFVQGMANSLIYLPIKNPMNEKRITTNNVRKKGKRESIL